MLGYLMLTVNLHLYWLNVKTQMLLERIYELSVGQKHFSRRFSDLNLHFRQNQIKFANEFQTQTKK